MANLHLSTIDIAVVLCFMLFSLFIGFRAGRGIKTIKDYAIANNSYSTPVLLMTLSATLIGGGSTTGVIAEIYEHGGLFIAAILAHCFSYIVVARYVTPKFDHRFDGMISSGDIIRSYYDQYIEKFSSVITVIAALGVITAQIVALGHVVSSVIGIPYIWAACLTGGILIAYSTFGGIKAVTITDVFQFAILVVTIPILAQMVLSEVGNFGTLISLVGEKDPSKLMIFGNVEFTDYMYLFLLYLFPINLSPSIFQRFMMFKNKKDITRTVYSFSFIFAALIFMCVCIAFSAIILLGDDIEPKSIITTFIALYLPTGIKGLVIAGMIAAIMSTADSDLNNSSVILVHNLLPKYFNNLQWAKISTAAIGAIALIWAMLDLNIIKLIASSGALLFIGVTIPTIAVILNLRVNVFSYWFTMALAFPVFFFGQFLYNMGFKALLFSMVTAVIACLVSIFFSNKGRMTSSIKKKKTPQDSEKQKKNLL